MGPGMGWIRLFCLVLVVFALALWVLSWAASSGECVVWYLGSALSEELGSPCKTDKQCTVENSHCSSGACTCKRYHARVGTTACLESKLLGRECSVSEQCSLRVANSTCRDGHCHCSEGFLRFRKHTCLGPAKVGDVCYGDDHCRLWAANSHCKFLIPKLFGKCTCDGEGSCEPHAPAPAPAPAPAAPTPAHPQPPPPPTPNPPDDNAKPLTANPLFVDPFLRQKEHLHDVRAPRPTETPTDTTEPREGTTEEEEERLQELTPEPPSEGSKYRVEANAGGEGAKEEWREVEGVSLGYPCESDLECQKTDGGSLCLEGVCDCAVKTDASGCGRDSTGCGPETFQCKGSGKCISWFFVCDGRKDCPDNSDEECGGPECPGPSFRCGATGGCVSLSGICDGVKNCPDGEDERLCGAGDGNATEGCPADSFHCANGQCLPKFEFCNAIPKCSDGSDEWPHLCSSQATGKTGSKRRYCPFECGNGRCRSTAIVCSGRDGCGDNSDEARCSVCRCPGLPTGN